MLLAKKTSRSRMKISTRSGKLVRQERLYYIQCDYCGRRKFVRKNYRKEPKIEYAYCSGSCRSATSAIDTGMGTTAWRARYLDGGFNHILVGGQRRKIKKEIWKTWKKQGCLVCGFGDERAIHAHHLHSSLKRGIVSLFVGGSSGGYSISRLLAELSKCIPLCSNCHSIFHSQGLADEAFLIFNESC